MLPPFCALIYRGCYPIVAKWDAHLRELPQLVLTVAEWSFTQRSHLDCLEICFKIIEPPNLDGPVLKMTAEKFDPFCRPQISGKPLPFWSMLPAVCIPFARGFRWSCSVDTLVWSLEVGLVRLRLQRCNGWNGEKKISDLCGFLLLRLLTIQVSWSSPSLTDHHSEDAWFKGWLEMIGDEIG